MKNDYFNFSFIEEFEEDFRFEELFINLMNHQVHQFKSENFHLIKKIEFQNQKPEPIKK